MTPRTLFLIQLIDRLGLPLMGAAQEADARSDKDMAETLAGLLGASVKLGLTMTGKMGLNEEDGDMDSVRVALSASAAHMISNYYKVHKSIPLDDAQSKLSNSVDAIITFAENFTAAQSHTARLKSLGNDKPLFDAAQSQIFFISAMQPVLAAVSDFSFGQSETALIKDITEKLQARATSLREALGGSGADEGEDRFTELMILHTLGRMYADVHAAETKALEAAGKDTAPDIENVWTRFDTQLAMLEALLNVALPGDTPSQSGSSAAQAPQPQAIAEAPPPPAEPTQAAPSAPQGNPMGFFKKPEPVTRVETPPAEIERPVQPDTPPVPPAGDEAPKGDPSNPMSFFKKSE